MKELRALTPEGFARAERRLRNPAPGSKIEAAQRFGIDLGLLLEKLRRPPDERVRRMHDFSNAMEQIRGIARRERAWTTSWPSRRWLMPEWNLWLFWDEATLHNGTIFTLMTDFDLLAEVAGVGSYDEVKRNSAKVQAFERDVCTLDLPALIRSKRAAGRTKDLLQLPELESLLEANKPE
jgi:hypothetical protein